MWKNLHSGFRILSSFPQAISCKTSALFLVTHLVCFALSLASPINAAPLKPAENRFTESIIQDKPEKLLLELASPNFSISSVTTELGKKVLCMGCSQDIRAGAPSLPVHSFQIISNTSQPQVTFQILESEVIVVPEGIIPNPTYLSPTLSELRTNDSLYQSAALLKERIFEIRTIRGIPTRTIEIPLALWSNANKSLTIIKKVQVGVVFPNVSSIRSKHNIASDFLQSIKNPVGGEYLHVNISKNTGINPLRKSAAEIIQFGKKFVKIKVGDRNLENLGEDKFYGISFSDLKKIGADLTGVQKNHIRMYTGSNDTIPKTMNGTILAGTLREISIDVKDNNQNSIFDETDSILFFGHGASLWKRIPGLRGPIRYEFGSDPYSFENYYYLDYSPIVNSVKRLDTTLSLPKQSAVKTSSYSYLRAEKDLQTAAWDISSEHYKDEETGYIWHWFWKGTYSDANSAITLSKSQIESAETDSLPDLDQRIPNDSLYVGVFKPFNEIDNSFEIYYGPKKDTFAILPSNFPSPNPQPLSKGNYYVWTGGVPTAPAFQLEGIRWEIGNRFDGYTVSYRRQYVFKSQPIWIFPSDFGKPITYSVQGGGGVGIKCLRIEDGLVTAQFLLDAEGTFTDSLSKDADAKYYLYKNPVSLPNNSLELESQPADKKAIQNLVTGDNLNPEYLIITPRQLLSDALLLRDYRNESKRSFKIKTHVVVVEDIYRQFSSGRMSPVAIRDFLRYALHGWSKRLPTADALKYVLFYGDGNYDYRNIRANALTSPPPNFIPPFEFFVSPGGEQSASEDFYAALDSTENEFVSAGYDLSIGRLPIQSHEQAAAYLQKITGYEDPAKAGEWRARFVLASDDGTQRGSKISDNGISDIDPISEGHTTSNDLIGKAILKNEPGLIQDNIYLLDYPRNSAFHKPEAAQDLLNLINRGTLMVNYVGHGASNQWADEALMLTNDALSRMHNEDRLAMINAFSCTVGRFESLTSEGMSEQFVKQAGVGAIAAVSSTRESYPGPNIILATAFYSRVFPETSTTQPVPVGQALLEAKNSSQQALNSSKYALLGEPVLLLRKPKLNVEFISAPDTIKALDCNTLRGKIAGGSGFGKVNIKIVAGFIHKDYLSNTSRQAIQKVDKHGNILFEQTIPYTNGSFSVDYFIPKQIPFGDSTAQILAFAWDASEEKEGSLAKQNLKISGTANSACATDSDGKGPKIKITGCEKKESGNIDFPNQVKISLPYCLQIEVQDSSGGILSSQGPDEGTTLEIPGVLDPFHPQAGVDELYFKSYQLSLDKQTIQPGSHLLKVSARDGFGNISQRQVTLTLTSESGLNTVSAYNIPNPMKRNGTTFYFSTIIPSADVDVSDLAATNRVTFEIRIFNQSGMLVKVFSKAISGSVQWDGHDEWGQLLANGVYFYSIIAKQSEASMESAQPTYRTISSKRNVLVISR